MLQPDDGNQTATANGVHVCKTARLRAYVACATSCQPVGMGAPMSPTESGATRPAHAPAKRTGDPGFAGLNTLFHQLCRSGMNTSLAAAGTRI